MYLWFLLISLLSGLLLTIMGGKIYQIFQLSSYKVKGMINWFKISKGDFIIRYFAAGFFSFIAMLVYLACFSAYKYVSGIGLLFFFLFGILFIMFTRKIKSKKPLVFTPRVWRFVVVSFLLFFAASFGLLCLSRFLGVGYSILGALQFLIPLIIVLAHYAVAPFEKLNNLGYKMRAVKKLEEKPQLIKIGITGSYGKTTAKNILAAMLQKKYNVCFSPDSYNTPMGISKVINNQLEYDAEVFIAEMGARNKGDIAELAKIVNPNYGIITAIGNQHLETFGNREVIKNTKFELIENLAIGGLAIFNGDSPDNIELFNRTKTEKLLTGGEDVSGANVYYNNVKTSSDGTKFNIIVAGTETEISTVLLGKHIPSLIVLCASVALAMGVDINDIAYAVKELKPVSHRLELIKNGDTTIIDDAYNSNTEGAKNALLLLKQFDGIKIIITPGIVELGTEEKAANIALGEQIAACADIAYLVGDRGNDIKSGAITAGMPEDKIFIVKDLNSAVESQALISGKKVVLFENDLPDNL